ncbi:MAG: hypothetical protein WA210_09335 [Burkholderiaceae bacterium]
MMRKLLSCAALTTLVSGAFAGEIYLGAGLPGVMLGFAQPLSSSFTVRGDWATLGTRTKQAVEEGVTYEAELGFNRIGVFADWFYYGGLRITGGVTFNDLKANYVARGNGTQFTIGSTTFTSATDDRLNVSIKYPKTTPYLGLGYGHQASTGFGFIFDIGASYGKATVSETHSGTNLGNPAIVSQANIDQEMAQLREGVARVKILPQLSIGINYRF